MQSVGLLWLRQSLNRPEKSSRILWTLRRTSPNPWKLLAKANIIILPVLKTVCSGICRSFLSPVHRSSVALSTRSSLEPPVVSSRRRPHSSCGFRQVQLVFGSSSKTLLSGRACSPQHFLSSSAWEIGKPWSSDTASSTSQRFGRSKRAQPHPGFHDGSSRALTPCVTWTRYVALLVLSEDMQTPLHEPPSRDTSISPPGSQVKICCGFRKESAQDVVS